MTGSSDTRDNHILALADELRTQALDFLEELPTSDPRCFFLSKLRQRLNDSIRELQSLKGAK